MHKPFYASGFLYNLKTQKILLLQSAPKDDVASVWSMLGGESTEGEDAQTTFQRILSELLNLNLKTKDIYPVYDYFHAPSDTTNFVLYAEVKKSSNFDSIKENDLTWTTFNDTLKLLFADHVKQDVVVGERVINLKMRISDGSQI